MVKLDGNTVCPICDACQAAGKVFAGIGDLIAWRHAERWLMTVDANGAPYDLCPSCAAKAGLEAMGLKPQQQAEGT